MVGTDGETGIGEMSLNNIFIEAEVCRILCITKILVFIKQFKEHTLAVSNNELESFCVKVNTVAVKR